MRRSLITVLLLCAGLVLGMSSAAKTAPKKKSKKSKAIIPAAVKLGRPVDFQKDIYPILEGNCVACHNVAIDESKLNLEDVASIMKGGKRGPAVVPGKPEKSLMYLLASRGKTPAMPPMPNKVDATSLSPRELGLLRQWILEGAKTGSGTKGMGVHFSPLPAGLNPIYSVALSPWGRLAAAGRSNQISIYDVVTGEEQGRLKDPALTPIQFNGKPMYPGGAAHRDFVHSLAFSPDGNLLASGGYRTVKLWRRPRNVQRFKVPVGNAVKALTISADGQWAAFATADKSIKLIDLKTAKVAKSLAGHTAAVTGLQFSADSKRLFSSSLDKSVRVWDLVSGKPQRKIVTPSPINDLAINKDATLVVTAGADNIIRVWKTAAVAPTKKPAGKKAVKKNAQKNVKKNAKKQPTGEKPVAVMKGHSKPVTSVALILPAGTQIVSGSEDGSVRIWTLSNGRLIRSMNHGGPVTDVAVRPDGQFIASAGSNNVAKLWQTSNGKQIAEMKGNSQSRQKVARLMEQQAVAKQKATATNNVVKAAEKNVKDRTAAAKKAKDAKTAADKAVAAAEKKAKPILGKLTAAKAAAAKKPKDNKLKKGVTTAQKAADKSAAVVKKAKGTQTAAARTVKLSNKSVVTAKAKLALAKKEKTAKDAQQKKVDAALKTAQTAEKAAGKPFRSVAFSTDGKWLITGGDDNSLNLFSGTNGRHLQTFAGHQSPVTVVAAGPKGTLLSGSADKTVISWNPRPAWKLVGRLGTTESAPLDLSTSPFVSRVLSLSFSPDGKKLATGGGEASRSGELMIWDVQKRTRIREIQDAHSDTILGLEFSPDGKQILSGSSDKFAKIFDVATGKKIRSFEGHTHHVLDVSWQADGSTIATAGADNVIKVWNVSTGEQKRTIGGYAKQVTSVQFIGISVNVVSCGGDKSVRFNRTSNGQNYRRFNGGTDYMYASAAARDAGSVIKSVGGEATIVIAGGEDGVLRMWTGTAKTIKNFEPPKPTTTKTQTSVKGKVKK